MLYFNSMASGGSGDGDFNNLLNFWQDSGDTTPNFAVPSPSDDVTLQDSPLTGSGSVHNLVDNTGGTFPISGASILVYGSAFSVAINSGSLIGSASSILIAFACIFNADPGGIINGSSACNYNSNIANSITDDGTGTFGAFTYGGNIISSGTISASSATFNGSVTASAISGSSTFNASVHCNNVTSGTYNNTLFQTGSNVFLINATLNSPPNWSGVLSAEVDGRCSFNLSNNGLFTCTSVSGNITADFPAAVDVLTGHTTNNSAGSLTLPTTAQVQSGVVYGVGGNGSTGSLVSSGGTSAWGS